MLNESTSKVARSFHLQQQDLQQRNFGEHKQLPHEFSGVGQASTTEEVAPNANLYSSANSYGHYVIPANRS